VVNRDDWGSAFAVMDRCGNTWPSALWEGLGEHGEGAVGYQLRRWSKTNSGTGAGVSSEANAGRIGVKRSDLNYKPPPWRQPAMSCASAGSSGPARANLRNTRARTGCCTAQRSSGVSAAASAK